ncbi:LOW QUALITY PROTEIN: hypothetical protein OSB04_003484 [Centaurea solstitialis]|uniref:CCHC-type domain-containing protein n=1 Tax=Centaurea solstitialis TaxID=347529 RepID=A0AA38UCL0_9ASTR|nr:LOW QUALITY PROTEIN: hypothetical protein OSB04_003484 [Centaurea solstitialis]
MFLRNRRPLIRLRVRARTFTPRNKSRNFKRRWIIGHITSIVVATIYSTPWTIPYIYSTFATAREIWESLETKYKTQVACSKKFAVGKFLNFKMNDSRSVVKQVEELQILAHERDVEVEEDNRKTEKDGGTSLDPNVNMVTGNTSKEKFNNERFLKSKGKFPAMKHGFNAKHPPPPNKRPFKKQTTHCWVCGKGGHKAKDCRFKRNQGNGGGNGGAGPSYQANIADTENRFIGVIEANMTTNNVDWWLDTGASRHICNSQSLFFNLY